MKEKTRFQIELERLAYRQIVIVMIAGCMFFCAVVFASSLIGQRVRQRRHMDSIEDSFTDIYRSVEEFLLGKENEAPVSISVVITDQEDEIIFTTMSQENINLHRANFHAASVENAKSQKNILYTTVYYFSGNTSEYVIVRPLYGGGQYLGSVSAYLKGKDWEKNFSKYQYDTIITDAKSNIIYCSNDWFVSPNYINKYYEPPNIYFIMIGVLTIVGLGLFWTVILFRLLQAMAAKTSASVHSLVDEIRIIRKADPEHVIRIETGDEIEEIAGQINNRMELQNIHRRIVLEYGEESKKRLCPLSRFVTFGTLFFCAAGEGFSFWEPGESKNSEISTRDLTVLIKDVIVLIEQKNQVPEKAPFQRKARREPL